MSSSCSLESVADLSERTISACLDEMVRRFKDQPAVFDPDQMMTFNDLHRSVNQLAHAIRQWTGAGRDPIVLLMGQRAMAVVGLLAILKAGKICVPANPVNNEARFLNAILDEMKLALVVTCRDHLAMAEKLSDKISTLDMEDFGNGAGDLNVVPPSWSEDAAVVVYTSGSRLCAYIVARDDCSPTAEDVQAYLRTRLPDYMVPSRVEFLPALPLNRSGKIDRHALPPARALRAAMPRSESRR